MSNPWLVYKPIGQIQNWLEQKLESGSISCCGQAESRPTHALDSLAPHCQQSHRWVIFIETSSLKKTKTISIEMLIHYLKEKSPHKWCDSWVSSRVNQRRLEGLYNSLRLAPILCSAFALRGNRYSQPLKCGHLFNRHFTQARIAFSYMMNPSLVYPG